MSSPNWATRFGISDRDLAELQNQLAGHDDPLRWILAKGHVASDEYTRWAMDEYGLPSVKDDYFAVPADSVFWEAVKHEFAWSPSFFPLTEWQGVMMIGCLQPPNFHFPLRTPHCFVIANAVALEKRFHELEPAHAFAAPAVTPEPVAAPAVTPEPAAQSHVRQRPADEVLAENLPQAPDVDMRDPEGLLIDVDSNSSINLFAVPEGMNVEDLGKPVPTTPDGLEPSTGLLDMAELDFSQPSAIAPAPAAPAAALASAAAAKTAAEPAVPPRAPIVPPGPPAAAVAAQQAAKADKAVMPPTPPPAPTTSRSNVSSSEPAIPLATCATIDSLTSSVVAHVNAHFEHAMLLTYDNAILRPSKWSELLLSVKGDNPDPISLEQASIFRIAARTSLPYHGYVVPNPTNMAFFNAFTRGIVPKHVTIMPIMIAGQLTGMLMGLSMVDVDYKASLIAMEKIASDFSTQLERLKDRGTAAA